MVRLKSASSILACVVAWGVSHVLADDANVTSSVVSNPWPNNNLNGLETH